MPYHCTPFSGLTTTPSGKLPVVTVTPELKPLRGTIESVTGWKVPGVTVIVDGVAEKTKLGVDVSMVSPTEALLEIVPEVPRRFNAAVPAAAFEPAVRFTVWAIPGVSVRFAGDAVTPAGRPERTTLIGR